MNDGWEYRHMDAGFDPAADSATDADPDNDGMTNGSGEGYPDYDYTLDCATNALPPNVVVQDPDGLFGTDETSTTFGGEGKVATISVYKFTVEEIRFNHDSEACATDAVSIRKTARLAYDASHGEWWDSGAELKNDPVCYAGGAVPTVKAKLRVSPSLASARLSATSIGANSPLGNLVERTVSFSGGGSDWTEFTLDAEIARTVRKADHRWEWKVSQINGAAVAQFVCATTGPHRVYTVLAEPKLPWMPNGLDVKNLWTNALEFCSAFLEGKGDPQETMVAITSNLFYNMGFRYDTEKGESHYWYKEGVFELTKYMAHADVCVNCHDQAYGVATFAGLLGVKAFIAELVPFGYINTVNIVGVGQSNNPCYERAEEIEYWKDVEDEHGCVTTLVMTNTVLHVQVCPQDETQRSFFRAHTFVWAHDGEAFDACIGPCLGTMMINDYLHSIVDISTKSERVVSRYQIGVENNDSSPSRNYILR